MAVFAVKCLKIEEDRKEKKHAEAFGSGNPAKHAAAANIEPMKLV